MLHALFVLAADPGSQVGKNAGQMLSGLAQPIYLGLVGLIAIALLAGRKLNALVIFLCVALAVGVVVYNPQGFASIAKAVGDTLSKGV